MESPLQETKLPEPLGEREKAIQSNNYARAVKVPESIGKPADEIKGLQQKAIRTIYCGVS